MGSDSTNIELTAKQNNELSKDNNELSKDNNELSKDNNELSKDNDELSLDNSELSKDNNELSKDNNELSKDNDELSNDNGELSKDNDELSNDNGELSKDNNELSKDNQLSNSDNIKIIIRKDEGKSNILRRRKIKKEFHEDDLFNDSDEEDDETKKKCIEKLLNCINSVAEKIIYLETMFTVLFGTSAILLVVVLFSDLNPSIIPFKIVKIELNSTVKLTQELSIFFTFISFITSNMLFMRIVLVLSFGIGIVSMVLAPPPPNLAFIMWYILILLINIKHASLIVYNKRNIKFNKEREKIYNRMFRKLMSKSDYQLLMSNSLIRTVNKGTYYINLGDTCSNLSILISGNMIKTDQNSKKTMVKKGTFIDSPEFIMRKYKIGQIFTISFFAETECKIIIWPREMLDVTLKKDKELNNKLLAALGIDVSNKFIAYSL